MNDGRTSPKRRHILSSINPEHPSASDPPRSRRVHRHPRSATPPPSSSGRRREQSVDDCDTKHSRNSHDTTQPRRSRLKLKGDRRSSRRYRSRDGHDDRHGRSHTDSREAYEDSSHQSRHHRRHSHRRHRRRRSRSPTPSNPFEPEPLDPETAFRESLFDAMADDEGAAYWEGVYGQPVHIYEQDKVGPEGELERMTDDEYAAHVRQKMWEKTHAGLLEERARRQARRREQEREAQHAEERREKAARTMRRDETLRARKRWDSRWQDYVTRWQGWDGSVQAMAWPWPGGAAEQGVDEKEVRAFFVQGLAAEEIGAAAFVARLKDERVRWHPDKMQQRLGGTVDARVMKDVTAIFQIIDRLWAEMRKESA